MILRWLRARYHQYRVGQAIKWELAHMAKQRVGALRQLTAPELTKIKILRALRKPQSPTR